ncbi:MAG: hypothetical protein V1728_04080, partial [Candidatus Micrarchaeota archaeon]
QLQTQTTKTEKRTVDDNLARGETKKTTKTAAEGGKTASDKPAAGKTSGNNESANINEQVAGGIIVGALASTNTGLDLLGKYFNFDDMVTFSSIVARMRNSYTQAQTDINSLYLNDAETGNRKLIELQEKIKEAFREKSISYSMLVGTSLEAGLIDKFGEDVETAFRSLADFENKLNAYMDLQSATSPDPAKTSAAQADLDAAKVALQQSLSKNRIGFQYVLGARYGPKLEGLSEVADILGITLTPDPDIANEFSVFIGRMFAPSAWQKAQMALSVLNHYPKTKEKLRIDQGAEVQTIKFSDGTFKDRIAIDPFSQIRFADMLSKNAAPASMTDEQLVPLVTAAKYMPAGTAGVILSSGAFLSYLAQFSSDQKTVGTIFNYASQKLSKVYARMPNGQKLAKMKEMMDGLKNLDVAGNLLSTIKQNYVSTNNKEINADMRIGNIFQIQLPYLMGRLVDPRSIALEPTPLFPSNYVPEVYEYSVPERPRTIEQFNLSKYKLNQYENTQPGTDYYVYRYAERQFGYAPGYMDVVNAIEKEYLRVIGSTFDTTRGLHLESLDNLGSSRPGAWAEKLDAYLKGDNGGQLGGYLYRRKEWGQTESSQTSAYLQGSDLRTILPWVEEKVNLLDLMAYYRTVDWGNLSNLEVKNDELRSTLNAQAQTAGSLVLNVFGTQTHSLSASGYESIAPRLDSQVYYLSSDGKWYAVGDLKIRNLNDQSLNSVLRNQEFGEIFANPGNDLRMDAAAMNSFIQHEGQDKKNGQALLLAIQPWSPVVVGGFSTLSQDYGVFGGTEITSADQKYIVDGGFVSFNYSALMSQGGMLGLNSLTNYYHAHDYDIRIPLKPEDVDRRLNVAKLAVLAYGEWEAQILGGWKSDRNLAATGGGVAGFRVAGTEGHVEAYADFDKGIKLSNIQEKTNEAYASAGGRLGAENKAGETNVLGYGANTRFWNEAGGALSVRLYDRGKGLKESGILTITGSNRQFAQAPVDIFAQGLVPQMKSFNEELNGPNPDYKDLGNKAAYINNWIFGTLPGISALSLPFGNNFSASYRGDDGGWKLSALNSKDGTWGTGIVTSGSFSFYGGGLLDNKGHPVSQSSELHYLGCFRVGISQIVFSVYLTKLRDDRAPAVIYSAGIGDFGMTTGAKTDASLWFAHIQAPAPAIPLNVLFNIAGTKEGYYAAEAGLVGNILGDFSVSGAYQKTYAQKGLFNQDRIATEINYNGKDYIIGGSYQLVGTKGYGSQSYYYLTVKHKL